MYRSVFVAIVLTAVVIANALADDKPHGHAHEDQHRSHGDETAFGRPADPAKARRTITVEMRDSNEFSPAEITVRQGDIVRFVAVNAGIEMHEMVLGTMQDLKAHAEMMEQH